MGAKEKADALHARGFNCAQSVLGALGDYTGLDEKTALAMAGGFGGGVCSGEICGALSGAVMALGLVFPYTDPGDSASRAEVRKQTAKLVRSFQERYGCVRCIDLKRSGQPCPDLIRYAAELAETTIKDSNTEGEEYGNL